MNEMFEDAFKNSVSADINGVWVKTLCPTEHLLFLILHSFKHFIYCGFGIRQILDFIVFATKNKDYIDSDKIIRSLEKVSAVGFFDALLCIADKDFGISPEELGFSGYAPEKFDTEDLMKDVLSGGAYGNFSKERIHSSKITLSATDNKKGGSLTASLFPPLEVMKSTHKYLNKCPILLPYAWCSRIISHLSKDKKERTFDAAKSIEIGKERLRMMKKYKILH